MSGMISLLISPPGNRIIETSGSATRSSAEAAYPSAIENAYSPKLTRYPASAIACAHGSIPSLVIELQGDIILI